MPLARLHAPFDHPDWIYELKWDGFRALAYVNNGQAQLVSRKQNACKSFGNLCQFDWCGALWARGHSRWGNRTFRPVWAAKVLQSSAPARATALHCLRSLVA